MNANDPRTSFDRLMDEARIRGESRMIQEGKKPDDVTKDDANAVIANLKQYQQESGMSMAQIARSAGCKPSTVSQVLAWKYPGHWQPIIIDLDRWLDDQRKADAAPRPTQYIETSVAQEIKTVADAAIQLRTIGLIYGGETSGVGKTMAMKAIAEEKPGAIYISIEEVAASTTGVLHAIARAMKISEGHPNPTLFEMIKLRLAGTSRLLIVDEIQKLCGAKKDKPFHVLADLHSKTEAPHLWGGTSDIVAYLDRGQERGAIPLAQIRRRIGIRRDLLERTRDRGDGGKGQPLYTIDEIRKVFAKNKMRLAPDGAKYLWMLACLPDSGALGVCKNVVVLATTVMEPKGVTVLTAEMLRSAHRELTSSRAFSSLEAKLSEQGSMMQLAKVG